jgi:hypothetical protein
MCDDDDDDDESSESSFFMNCGVLLKQKMFLNYCQKSSHSRLLLSLLLFLFDTRNRPISTSSPRIASFPAFRCRFDESAVMGWLLVVVKKFDRSRMFSAGSANSSAFK